jgi:hypothetical protein
MRDLHFFGTEIIFTSEYGIFRELSATTMQIDRVVLRPRDRRHRNLPLGAVHHHNEMADRKRERVGNDMRYLAAHPVDTSNLGPNMRLHLISRNHFPTSLLMVTMVRIGRTVATETSRKAGLFIS